MSTATKRIGAVAAVAALAIVALWYVALFQPQGKKLAKAHAAHVAAQQQITQLHSQAAQLQALERQIPSDKLKLAGLKANVPDNPDLDGALTQLHQAAVTTGVTLTTVGPALPAAPSGAAAAGSAQPQGTPSINVSLTAIGTYPQLMAFMTALSTMNRTVVVDHVAITSGQQNGALSANIGARVFYAGQPTP